MEVPYSYVRYGSEADVNRRRHIRPLCLPKQTSNFNVSENLIRMSALSPIADINPANQNVRL